MLKRGLVFFAVFLPVFVGLYRCSVEEGSATLSQEDIAVWEARRQTYLNSFEDIVELRRCNAGSWYVWCKNGTTEVRHDSEISSNNVCLTKQVMVVNATSGTFLSNPPTNCFMANGFRTWLTADATVTSTHYDIQVAAGAVPSCSLTSGKVLKQHAALPVLNIPGWSSGPSMTDISIPLNASGPAFPEYPKYENCEFASLPLTGRKF